MSSIQESRRTELEQGSRRIKLAEEIMKREHKDSVTVLMTDGREIRDELTINARVIKTARGYLHGVVNEMFADGQQEDVRVIFERLRR